MDAYGLFIYVIERPDLNSVYKTKSAITGADVSGLHRTNHTGKKARELKGQQTEIALRIEQHQQGEARDQSLTRSGPLFLPPLLPTFSSSLARKRPVRLGPRAPIAVRLCFRTGQQLTRGLRALDMAIGGGYPEDGEKPKTIMLGVADYPFAMPMMGTPQGFVS